MPEETMADAGMVPESPTETTPSEEPPPSGSLDMRPSTAGDTAAAPGAPPAAEKVATPKTLSAKLEPRSKSKVSGTVNLVEKPDGVELTITLEGAKKGPKGLHLHEKADCSAPDAKSAGEHWNPESHQHGLPESPQKHMGDLGNIEVQKDGTATLTVTVAGANLGEGDKSLVGKALVLHSKKDDGKTQPSGNSGDRIGCAEIK
jgi:Cu-Zn family superoxide dismutase